MKTLLSLLFYTLAASSAPSATILKCVPVAALGFVDPTDLEEEFKIRCRDGKPDLTPSQTASNKMDIACFRFDLDLSRLAQTPASYSADSEEADARGAVTKTSIAVSRVDGSFRYKNEWKGSSFTSTYFSYGSCEKVTLDQKF